jgi:hypothetical protein
MQLNGLRYQVSTTGNLLFESPEKDRVHDDHLFPRPRLPRRLAQQVDRSKPILRSADQIKLTDRKEGKKKGEGFVTYFFISK